MPMEDLLKQYLKIRLKTSMFSFVMCKPGDDPYTLRLKVKLPAKYNTDCFLYDAKIKVLRVLEDFEENTKTYLLEIKIGEI